MNDHDPPPRRADANLKGLGCARKRVEDARFTQGKGNYIDDMKLPGMLFGDFVRSPYAHARVKSIDASAALALPGVIAVLTAKDLEPLGLHWMPTLAGDKQMVLADGKVLFQGQEVAFVVAADRYIAADAIELVEVEYEDLPVITDPFKSLNPDARSCARTWKPDRAAPMATASTTTTSSCGNWATRKRRGRDQPRPTWSPRSASITTAPIPARWSPAARGLDGQGERQADALRHIPGAACGAHRRLAAVGDRGAQHPRHLPRHRRRLRQQGRASIRAMSARSSPPSSPACR